MLIPVQIWRAPMPLEDVQRLAREQFGDFVKAVVDVPDPGEPIPPRRGCRHARRIQEIVARLIGA